MGMALGLWLGIGPGVEMWGLGWDQRWRWVLSTMKIINLVHGYVFAHSIGISSTVDCP